MKGFKIFGKVLALDTQQGIPNLVIGAFDRDPEQQQPEDPLTNIGDALGSTLTNSAGEFEISFTTEDFIQHDSEGRPDLVLAVFAPSDTRLSDESGGVSVRAEPRYKRLLHFIDIPRKDAAKSEAYVIRLLSSQIEKLSLRPSAQHSKERHEQHYVWLDAISKVESARRKEDVKRKRDLRKIIQKAIPKSAVKRTITNEDPRLSGESSETANRAMVVASAIGLRKLFDLQSKKPPTLSLNLPQLERLDLKEDQNGEKSISSVALVRVLNEIHPGAIEKSSLNSSILKKLEKLKTQIGTEEDPHG